MRIWAAVCASLLLAALNLTPAAAQVLPSTKSKAPVAKTTAAPKTAPAKQAKTKAPANNAKPTARRVVPRADAPASADDKPPDNSPAAKSVRDSYNAFTLAQRIALQSDLVWTGDYNGLVNGEFSERLVAAVKAFQTRNKSKPTGVLNPQERAILANSAKPLRDEVGWKLTEDPVTNAFIGLPLKLATQMSQVRNGTRWASAQGQLQIETFKLSDTTLERVFETQKRQPVERKVTYSVLRPEFFVISGTQVLKKFYVRGTIKDGEVRGISVMYDQAMEGTMDPVVIAMSSAFNPFPPDNVAADGTPLKRRVDYGTGLIVNAQGYIVTDRQIVDGCRVIVVPGLGSAERMTQDKTGDLALLRVYGAQKLKPLPLIGGTPGGDSTSLVGIADPQAQGGADKISVVAARLGTAADARPIEPTPALGFSGAAALDATGHVLGMVVFKPTVVAGAPSAPRAALVSRDTLVNFLEAHYVAPTSGPPGVEPAKAAVVRVICVRK